MAIQLSDHFTTRKLLRFTFPSIVMMIFTSVYIVVDGFFISNFVGKTAFAAANFITPYLLLLGALGFMFGTGGSALIAKSMGEGNPEKAQEQFSLFVYVAMVSGIVITILGLMGLRPVAMFLGAEEAMLEECVVYGRTILIAMPAYTLQYAFQAFFCGSGKTKSGLGGDGGSRAHQYGLGCPFGGGHSLGACGGSFGNGARSSGGWHFAIDLFCTAEYQSSAFG